MNSVTPESPLWPFIVYTFAIIGLIGLIIGISFLLGQRHRERATDQPYESGMVITGSARTLFDVRFYLIAVFFVIFDLEAVFIFSWAVAVRELGWPGYIEILVFIGVLLAGLVYLWRIGALELVDKTSYGHRKVQ
ncbi:NADH:ubiquinone oxidoreductase subunit 3 (chain A) [Desulfomonile tiedjei DSM 6799]|uniref:NADH-quinone oxidoreductase subunit A n=1 Tax=Desulfomonile tiedjei (strain ATCC 49306 / DSM 6799 / DCB-1) TaxID=706587 RepID=I4CCU0_DESTA|nr:NADH-quinone oxidoreductase subunit A [Desulfomonile tiedjei]AFM27381.1 NADH:ubiquinone oxidoreductase subunit 3 (chain A) [Desulfomonile tiedjei DSM 6799]